MAGLAQETTPPAERKRRRRASHGIIATVATVAGSVIAVVAFWVTSDTLPSRVCTSETIWGIRASDWACNGKWERIEVEQANEFVDDWLAEAGGANPVGAWSTLSESARGARPADKFEAGWEPVLSAERNGSVVPVPGEFNAFTVSLLEYLGDGITDDKDFTDGMILSFDNEPLTLTIEDGDLRMADFEFTKDDVDYVHFPLVVIRDEIATTKARIGPTVLKRPTGAIDMRAGQSSRMYCASYVQESEDEGQWWFWTRLGWLPEGDAFIPAEDSEGYDRPCQPQHAAYAEAFNFAAANSSQP